MVEPARIMAEVRSALSSMVPDGRYALEGATFAPAWEVFPDHEEYLSLRDLGCQALMGGPRVDNAGTLKYPLSVEIFGANYVGTRTSHLSNVPLTAYERLQGMALHVLETLANTTVPSAAIFAAGAEQPIPTAPREEGQLSDWLTGRVLFNLIAT